MRVANGGKAVSILVYVYVCMTCVCVRVPISVCEYASHHFHISTPSRPYTPHSRATFLHTHHTLVDYCSGILCGGPSTCTNEDTTYKCHCASGWSGGGIRTLCTGKQLLVLSKT